MTCSTWPISSASTTCGWRLGGSERRSRSSNRVFLQGGSSAPRSPMSRRVADALGERRDRDVTIAALEEFAGRGFAVPGPSGGEDADRGGCGLNRRRRTRRWGRSSTLGNSAALVRATHGACRERAGRSRTRSTSSPRRSRSCGCPSVGRPSMKARSVKRLDPGATLEDNAAGIIRSASTSSLLHSRTRWSSRGRSRPARHADRRQAPSLHPRNDRILLRQACADGGGVEPATSRTARGDARLRRDAARVEAHLAAIRAEDATAVRGLAGDSPDLDPRLAAHAEHRTAFRGLEVLGVYVRRDAGCSSTGFASSGRSRSGPGPGSAWRRPSVGIYGLQKSAAGRPGGRTERIAARSISRH